ncbi:MAG: alpha-galactosidase, partial [Ilumatobacter sp.]|nr:alpha-galactosidase [Ilumatobacter sp.]
MNAFDLTDVLTGGAGPNSVAAALRVSSDHRIDPATGAIGITRTLEGEAVLEPIALEVTFDLDELVLHSLTGGRSDSAVPPTTFARHARRIHPRADAPGRPYLAALSRLDLGSDCGRSSGGDMPFFLLTDPGSTHGLWFAIGHSGSWRAVLSKSATHPASYRLQVRVGDGDMHLEPGERVVLPTVWVGEFRGDGWAALRAHLEASAPRVHVPWTVFNTWFGDDAAIDAQRLIAHAEVAAEVGVEAFVVDAGWYETPPGDRGEFMSAGLGTWTPDPVRFPDGLESVADRVRELGMTFGLWFEPERAHPDSYVARAHPEWLRTVPTSPWAMVDFGIEAVRRWAVDTIDAAVSAWSLGWIKWDMNHARPSEYWSGDPVAELSHCRGVWWVLDEIRRRNPGLVIEGCASGGHRIDIEMVRRCDTFWISDQTVNSDTTRHIVRQAARLLPAQYRYLSIAPAADPGSTPPYPDEWFVGACNGVFGLMDVLADWPDDLRHRVAAHIDRFRSVRHLLGAHVVDLSDRPDGDRPLAGWEAWEMSDASGEAALVALRVESPDATREFRGTRTWTVELPPGGATLRHI